MNLLILIYTVTKEKTFRGAKREALRFIVLEINISIDDKRTITDLRGSTENSDIHKNKPTFVLNIKPRAPLGVTNCRTQVFKNL